MFRRELDLFFVAAFQCQECHPAERRVFQLTAKFDFLVVKPIEVMPAGELNRWVKWRECLHYDFALDITATSAAGHLREQLKCSLSGAEVWLMQCEVG